MLKSVRRFVAGVLCVGAMAASAEQSAEKIRLAPPQAMFRDSITLNQFVSGTLRFVLLHEIGHGFVDLYGIPVLGREEDAADRFATGGWRPMAKARTAPMRSRRWNGGWPRLRPAA
ncbi:MAG: hypothetical protein IPP28_00160 [Xanthomonadales bacterium]|nr:hypothetical protein [Xanthomonadales bacterium]